MRKVFGFFIATLVISNVSFAADFVYVDLMKLFNEYNKTVAYDEALAEKQAEKEASLQKKNDELMKMQDELKLLKDDAKKAKQEELAKLGGAMQQEYKASLDELKKERDTKMAEVLKDIEDEIAAYAKEKKLPYVLKKASIAYADEANDRTEEVLKRLNK